MAHILMGAFNTITNKYEYPRIAEKTGSYTCPECNKAVILKKGNIRVHHFAHYRSENPCMYYERPGESQVHKDAKLAFKTILERETNIQFLRTCISCKKACRHNIEKKSIQDAVKMEHSFIFNDSRKIADLAYIEDGSIKYIFEICYKHKTRADNRPEPWFEIDAESLLRDINIPEYSDNLIELKCIRSEKCNICVQIEINEKEKRRLKEIEYNEKKRLKEIEEKRERDILEYKRNKGTEIKTLIWSQHKRCSKCKSFERCMPCVNKLWKKYNLALKEAFNEDTPGQDIP